MRFSWISIRLQTTIISVQWLVLFLGVVIVVVVVVLVVAAKECNYSEDEVVIAQVHKCWKSIRLATINSALLCCC